MRSIFSVVVSLFVALPLFAQNISVGSMPSNPDISLGSGSVHTIIDFGNPAKVAGEVNFASFSWSGNPGPECANAFKVKILRPTNLGPHSYEVVDDIGPFDAVGGYRGIILSGNTIEVGDLLGVSVLSSDPECGTIMFERAVRGAAVYVDDGDLTGIVNLDDMELSRIGTMALRLSTELYPLDGIIPVVGSAAGAFGSNFRTAIQLNNPSFDHSIDGKLVFRPANGDAAKEVEYSIGPGKTQVFNDFVAEIGSTGLGSVEIRPAFSPIPVVSTRIFTDQGANGTLGFNEPLRTVDDAMGDAEYGSFITAADLGNFRMNVGVRALERGATLLIQHLDANGNQVGNQEVRQYAPNSFSQVALATFVNTTPAASGLVSIRFIEGEAIVYASTTDNRTNDSLLTFVTRGQ